MTIARRAFSEEADRPLMSDLVHRFPADNLHVADLPYRLSSWALDDPENVALWAHGKHLVAWAVLQAPFWAIDYAYDPHAGDELHREILRWADGRAQQVLGSPSERPRWYVNVSAGQGGRIRDLEEAGFAPQANVPEDPWSKVLMFRPAGTAVAGCTVPEGFTIRPLAGEGEVEAYVDLHRAVFESTSMTAGWRARTLQQPEHVLELDLVAVAPDGLLGALCVCWLDRHSKPVSGQIEPLGVRQDLRGLGLARAILAEGLRRLQLHGAERVYVETDNYRNAAFALYQSAGFGVMRDVLVYRKDYA